MRYVFNSITDCIISQIYSHHNAISPTLRTIPPNRPKLVHFCRALPHSAKESPFPGIRKAGRGRTLSGQMTPFLHFISLKGKSLSLSPYILTSYQSKHAKRTTQASYQNLGGYMAEWVGFEPTVLLPVHLISSVLSKVEPAGKTVLLPEAAGSGKCRKIRRFQTCGGHPAQQAQGLEKNHGSLRFWREFCILERKSERKTRERSAGKRLSRWPIQDEVRFHDR